MQLVLVSWLWRSGTYNTKNINWLLFILRSFCYNETAKIMSAHRLPCQLVSSTDSCYTSLNTYWRSHKFSNSPYVTLVSFLSHYSGDTKGLCVLLYASYISTTISKGPTELCSFKSPLAEVRVWGLGCWHTYMPTPHPSLPPLPFSSSSSHPSSPHPELMPSCSIGLCERSIIFVPSPTSSNMAWAKNVLLSTLHPALLLLVLLLYCYFLLTLHPPHEYSLQMSYWHL